MAAWACGPGTAVRAQDTRVLQPLAGDAADVVVPRVDRLGCVDNTLVPPKPLPNPWSTRSSRAVYGNAWIDVREDMVTRPDGSPGIYGVVSFRNLALGAVPLLPDGTTVLVGQYRYTLDAWSWEIPEGGGDPRRPPEEEMARELVEETGLVALRWTPLGELHTSNSVTDERALLFLAEDLVQEAARPDPTEDLVTWRLPLAEAVAMAVDGRITDSMSVAGLLRADRLLAGRG
jgi:8-oxo-dGTP pyrophosphatase MutT (NUDIX family)